MAREGGRMDERDMLARRFDAERGRLGAVAYRMLGSLAAALPSGWARGLSGST
jgi:hypothetical protein